MGNIPVLKPQEVGRILERLGFETVRQRGRISSTDIKTEDARPFPATLEEKSHRYFFGRLQKTSA